MKRQKGFMDPDLFKKVISEMYPYLYYVNLFFQGEPMLHPQFFSFTEITGNIYTVVSTNGHYLTLENCEKLARSRVSKLIVSLDGMDQITYSRYRREGDFMKVKEGILNMVNAKKRIGSSIRLEIQYLVNKFNEHHIDKARAFAADAGLDLKLKSMQILSEDDNSKWLPSDKKYRRYDLVDDRLSIRNKMPDRCPRLWFNPVITWDGKVLPCCFDKEAEFIMGDLNNESFRSIWNGELYDRFRQEVVSARKKIHICRNCTSGMRNIRY